MRKTGKVLAAIVTAWCVALPVYAAAAEDEACVAMCHSSCIAKSETLPAAKCATVDPESERICYVLFGECTRVAQGICGWKANPDLQKCKADPKAYTEQYNRLQQELIRKE